MRRFVASQLRHRPSRVLALGVAIVAASASFILLAAAAKTGGLKVTGSVKSSFRPAYDVLVRPEGSKTSLERTRGLVRDNYLSGIFGGISKKQYREIESMSGVEVAAPIANVGYVLPWGYIPVSIQRFVNLDPVQLYRLRLSWVAHNGASVYPEATLYVYYNRNHRFTATPVRGYPGDPDEIVPGQGPQQVCVGFSASNPESVTPFSSAGRLFCFSAKTPHVNRNNFFNFWSKVPVPKGIGAVAGGVYPILLAAIDPVQEERLLHLDRAVVSGRALEPKDRDFVSQIGGFGHRFVPVMVSRRNYVRETLDVAVERLRIHRPKDVPGLLTAGICEVRYLPCPAGQTRKAPAGWPRGTTAYSFLTGARGTVVGHAAVPIATGYRGLLFGGRVVRGFTTNDSPNFWTVSATTYRRLAGGALQPLTTTNRLQAYSNPVYAATGFVGVPADNRDVQFRRLTNHPGSAQILAGNVAARPTFAIVGRYDPAKLPGFSPLSKVPLETYYPPLLEPRGAESTRILHGQPLAPTQNLADYIQQPPLMLTTIRALGAFTHRRSFVGSPPLDAKAPISVIRVRVSGATGPDARSEARIRSVALRIHNRTGLDVDITAGSSPHPLTIRLPRGKFGRPALTLSEGWVKKGVSVAFLNGVGRKQLALFTLIPLLCCLFLGNGTYAAARVRRAEIGTLLTLGWSPRMIFSALLGEVLVIGFLAGLLGVGIAAALVAVLSLHAQLWVTLLVLPVSLAIALVAGLLPAWHAARAEPLTALRPPVADVKRTHPVQDLTRLAFVNLRRVPARALVGGCGLMLGACALTVLLAVQRSFQGVLAGTLLGDAISIEIRGFDYLAVGLVIALAALSIADVLYLNLRERQAELVTLRTFGWSERHLARVVGAEALALALGSTLIGAALGIVVCAVFLAVPFSSLVLGALAAVSGGILATLLASLLPLSQLERLTPPTVLAADE
ncbi:MAG TPA: FtsX-like permease family protein [Gaiellaceae bacterium]|nr:FtsX-like permease family protein [Gaiellaceae bacterium]